MNLRWPLNKFSKTTMAKKGTMVYRATWDPTANAFPNSGNTTPAQTSIKQGWVYKAVGDGAPDGVTVLDQSLWMANKDNPGNLRADWEPLS